MKTTYYKRISTQEYLNSLNTMHISGLSRAPELWRWEFQSRKLRSTMTVTAATAYEARCLKVSSSPPFKYPASILNLRLRTRRNDVGNNIDFSTISGNLRVPARCAPSRSSHGTHLELPGTSPVTLNHRRTG